MVERPVHDLIVVGAGIAGLSAAIRAAELGLKVVLLERGAGEKYLCNTRMSGGILHVAFRSVKTAPDALLRTIEETTQGRADPSLARALAETSGRAVDWLREQGAKFIRFARVEYQHHVLAPPRRNMPGPDWDGRGPDYLLRTLVRNFAARGGVFLQGVRARELMQRSGTCYGVEAEELDGGSSKQRQYSSRMAVSRGISTWSGRASPRRPTSCGNEVQRRPLETVARWHRRSARISQI
jgi:fumarate reductase flavoprotein subunit